MTFVEKFTLGTEAAAILPGCKYVLKHGTKGRLECPFRSSGPSGASDVGAAQRACGSVCAMACQRQGKDAEVEIGHPLDFMLRTLNF